MKVCIDNVGNRIRLINKAHEDAANSTLFFGPSQEPVDMRGVIGYRKSYSCNNCTNREDSHCIKFDFCIDINYVCYRWESSEI